ncbi:prolyl oligopeptidase family serine peptidase [Teredinibacter sp. KSP-S5-2]|uniref:prolyl oligopeptidase family serine peptidase n=1 Tax=Teredinibacter sp. KSP-S5-2 TaxID=3034506 RepID=UPI0029351615|nr:prolyl oligopeptidase family serine peptidase [Teredinibacter sp. KSP-S5-2]WNO11603.1 prolyl oligopeptidase family serine peptidase [Teredinibacter sp. KSP-S5-2]
MSPCFHKANFSDDDLAYEFDNLDKHRRLWADDYRYFSSELTKLTELSINQRKSGHMTMQELYSRGSEFSSIFCLKTDRKIVDFNQESQDYSYFCVGSWALSRCKRYIFWLADTCGNECYELFIRDLISGKTKNIDATNLSGLAVWGEGGKLYLIQKTIPSFRESSVLVYSVDDDSWDVLLEETDSRYKLSFKITSDSKYLLVVSRSTYENVINALSLSGEGSIFSTLDGKAKNIKYQVDHSNSGLVLSENRGAMDVSVYHISGFCDLKKRGSWKKLNFDIEDGQGLIDIKIYDSYIVLKLIENAQVFFRLYEVGDLNVCDEFRSCRLEENTHFLYIEKNEVFFRISSLSGESESHRTAFQTACHNQGYLLSAQDERSGLVCQRYLVKSEDLSLVPVTIVHAKDVVLDGKAPALICAYGAYGLNFSTDYNQELLPLLKKGVVYIIAHVRGGGERGGAWSEEGKREKKINTFVDFDSVVKFLIFNNFVDQKKIFAKGYSAGGLIMAWLANSSSHDFAGILACCPFVDVLGTMSDENAPGTTTEYSEWGNPREDYDHKYISAYSPYQNVTRKRYSPMYILSGAFDSQVRFTEVFNWYRRLKGSVCNFQDLIMVIDFKSGHLGRQGIYQRCSDIAQEYAYIFYRLSCMEKELS